MEYSKSEIRKSLIKISKQIPDDHYQNKYFANALDRYVDILSRVQINAAGPSKVLDVGCGYGDISAGISRLGHEVYAIDLYNENIFNLKENSSIKFQKHNLEADPLPFEDNFFDFVIFTEVLEHINYSPLVPLKEIKRVLKKNGRLILATPNINRIKTAIVLLMGKNIFHDLKSCYIDPVNIVVKNGCPYIDRHVRLYTIDELKELFKMANMEIEEMRYSYNPGCSGQNIFRIIIHRILKILLNLTQSRFLGDFILITAKK